MKNAVKYVLLLGAVVHFATIAAFHIPLLSTSIHPEILYHNLLRRYTLLSGIHGGYGFYGPSVGNTYQMHHHLQSRLHSKYSSHAQLRSASGRIRLQSYLDIGSSFLSENKADTASKQLAHKAVVQLTQRIKAQYPCDTISSTLVTKLIPTIQQLQDGADVEAQYINLIDHVEAPNQHP
ncbi:hypothetical protein KO02_21605 [Sphingobacterium sp. ML3W]|uniref:hypothetical protein n=1 Tax=Sphingobacterium sp. ML3W TaxID=1538644 RepID=UPI0004F90608|nr:hypothetical protein [Sphingobacterium sp. ML3W]AIM38999.1 hypothetical protein KO02_21605 [Sphingobacterium sp. ML3W]